MKISKQERTPLVLSIVTFPIVAAILILSATGVATVLLNQKISGEKVSLAKAVLSAQDDQDTNNDEDTNNDDDTNDAEDVEDSVNVPGNNGKQVKEKEKNAGEEGQIRNMLQEGTFPTSNNSGKKTVVEGEGYKITIHAANQNSNGLAAQERIKVQLRRSLEENTDFSDKITDVQLQLEQEAADGTAQYRAVATKSKSLFGIFKISIPVEFITDDEGNIIKIEDQSIFKKILDAVSF